MPERCTDAAVEMKQGEMRSRFPISPMSVTGSENRTSLMSRCRKFQDMVTVA